MKKLMIAAAIVCAAAASYAAQANWEATAKAIYNGTGSSATSAKYSGTAYFFDAGLMSQANLFDIVSGGGTIGSGTTGYMATADVASGVIAATAFKNGEQGDGKTYSYYFAIVDAANDKMYFSNIKSATPNAGDTAKPVTFGFQYDDEEPASYRPNSTALPTDGYQGAGQWATVPEPTSGLLLLLGVAGLALRRRRA